MDSLPPEIVCHIFDCGYEEDVCVYLQLVALNRWTWNVATKLHWPQILRCRSGIDDTECESHSLLTFMKEHRALHENYKIAFLNEHEYVSVGVPKKSYGTSLPLRAAQQKSLRSARRKQWILYFNYGMYAQSYTLVLEATRRFTSEGFLPDLIFKTHDIFSRWRPFLNHPYAHSLARTIPDAFEVYLQSLTHSLAYTPDPDDMSRKLGYLLSYYEPLGWDQVPKWVLSSITLLNKRWWQKSSWLPRSTRSFILWASRHDHVEYLQSLYFVQFIELWNAFDVEFVLTESQQLEMSNHLCRNRSLLQETSALVMETLPIETRHKIVIQQLFGHDFVLHQHLFSFPVGVVDRTISQLQQNQSINNIRSGLLQLLDHRLLETIVDGIPLALLTELIEFDEFRPLAEKRISRCTGEIIDTNLWDDIKDVAFLLTPQQLLSCRPKGWCCFRRLFIGASDHIWRLVLKRVLKAATQNALDYTKLGYSFPLRSKKTTCAALTRKFMRGMMSMTLDYRRKQTVRNAMKTLESF